MDIIPQGLYERSVVYAYLFGFFLLHVFGLFTLSLGLIAPLYFFTLLAHQSVACLQILILHFLGHWVVINKPIPRLGKIYVYGVLEINNTNPDLNVEIIATHIQVLGGKLIAGYPTPGDHMQGSVTITLSGDHNTPDMTISGGPNMGAKALGKEVIFSTVGQCGCMMASVLGLGDLQSVGGLQA